MQENVLYPPIVVNPRQGSCMSSKKAILRKMRKTKTNSRKKDRNKKRQNKRVRCIAVLLAQNKHFHNMPL